MSKYTLDIEEDTPNGVLRAAHKVIAERYSLKLERIDFEMLHLNTVNDLEWGLISIEIEGELL